MRLKSLGPKLAVSIGAVLVCALLAEAIGRGIGFDFSGQLRALEAYPIYYRQPRKPVDPVFFHRYGPDRWTGRPLSTAARLAGVRGDVYGDEPTITVTYDADGFRNPEGLRDWDIVVVGDSFVEAGYLPEESLFTTQLAGFSGLRVRNLGCSYTGPLSYLTFLDAFGFSASTKEAVLVFFEGNDVTDLIREAGEFDRFRETGERSTRELEAQTSFLRWVSGLVRGGERGSRGEPDPDRGISRVSEREPGQYHNAYLRVGGEDVPVSVASHPPWVAQLSTHDRELLDFVISRFAELATARGVRPRFLYMPCKGRVWAGRLRFAPDADPVVRAWQPTDLPAFMESLASRHNVAFLDVTDVLQAGLERDEIGFNPIWDTHLDADGCRTVGKALADRLSAAAPSSEGARQNPAGSDPNAK